jgi:hypothetical protein
MSHSTPLPVQQRVTCVKRYARSATMGSETTPAHPAKDPERMSAAAASQETPTVEQPKHPLHALTTYELRDYRRDLERAIECFQSQDPAPPARDVLQARLDAVIAEQESRQKIAGA